MRLCLSLLLLLLTAAPASAAPDLRSVSGPGALREVDLAGRWTFVPKGQAATTIEVPGGGWVKQGFTTVKEATYERRVTVPAVQDGQVTQLWLGAVNHQATLFVDGKEVATNTTSFTPSAFDLTKHVTPGR